MQTTDYLTVLNILVALVGVLFVVFTLFEWGGSATHLQGLFHP